MRTLTLKNIPTELYERLKEMAQAHRRSLNSEVLYCVERTLNAAKIDATEYIAAARVLRSKTAAHPITNDEIDAAKNKDRP